MPALTLLAPLLVSATGGCYLVTNTRIAIIPCKFGPETIAARIAELESSEPRGPAAATSPQRSTPRVQARERPQSGAPRDRSRGGDQAAGVDRDATARGSNAQDLAAEHPATSSGPQQPTPQPGPQATPPQSGTAAQPAPRGSESQQPVAPEAARPGPEPQPSPTAQQGAAASQPSAPPQPSPVPQPSSVPPPSSMALPSSVPQSSSASQPSAPPQAASRGAEAQQLLDATVAELRAVEGTLASGSPGDAGAVLARAGQALATASSPRAAAAITAAQQALARGDLYATRQAIAVAIAAATAR